MMIYMVTYWLMIIIGLLEATSGVQIQIRI